MDLMAFYLFTSHVAAKIPESYFLRWFPLRVISNNYSGDKILFCKRNQSYYGVDEACGF